MKFLNHNNTEKGESMHKRFLFVAFMFAFLVSAFVGIPEPMSEIEFDVQTEKITVNDEDTVINDIDLSVTLEEETGEKELNSKILQLTSAFDKDHQVFGIDAMRVEYKLNYKEWARSIPMAFVEHPRAPPRI
jgi:hypothetical protein